MNAASMKQGLVRLGGLGALTGLTVLLTLLFSFLGNLTCAVVAGMVLGSGRRWQWNAVPVSLVFPAVILSLSYFSKVELPPAKVYLVALVSSGAFWAVLGLTFGLRFLERNGESPPPVAAGASRTQGAEPASPPPFNLAALRGSWTCEQFSADGAGQSKTLRIEEGRFVLLERNSRNRERVVVRGEVSASQTGPGKIVFTANAPGDQDR